MPEVHERSRTSSNSPTESRSEPTETTPLNQNISRSNQANEQVPVLNARMDAETKSVLVKIAVDVVLLLCGEF